MNQYQTFYDNISQFIFVEDELKPADVIFVPGNRYPEMAERAAALWKAGLGKWILPSGRYSILLERFQGPCRKQEQYCGDYATEWEFLKDVLIQNGVDPDVVLKEDQASYTYENALRSKAVLEQNGIEMKKGIICCNTVHARRCKMYYQVVFPDCEFMIAPVDATGVTKENWHRSASGIESVLSEMDRCGRQFQQILEELQKY